MMVIEWVWGVDYFLLDLGVGRLSHSVVLGIKSRCCVLSSNRGKKTERRGKQNLHLIN